MQRRLAIIGPMAALLKSTSSRTCWKKRRLMAALSVRQSNRRDPGRNHPPSRRRGSGKHCRQVEGFEGARKAGNPGPLHRRPLRSMPLPLECQRSVGTAGSMIASECLAKRSDAMGRLGKATKRTLRRVWVRWGQDATTVQAAFASMIRRRSALVPGEPTTTGPPAFMLLQFDGSTIQPPASSIRT